MQEQTLTSLLSNYPNYQFAKKLIITTNENKQFTQNIIRNKNLPNSSKINSAEIFDYLLHKSIVHFEFIGMPKKRKIKKTNISKNTISQIKKLKKLNKPIHVLIQKELAQIIENDGLDFTEEKVNEWNNYLPFNLKPMIKKYGASGSRQLYTIFNL